MPDRQDAHDVLRRGRIAQLEGRHEEALRDLVWFHHNALKHDRALYGVRLSFALGYWKELADAYPPARRALDATKKEACRVLLESGGSRDLFHEVVAINRELGERGQTYRFFVSLRKKYPDLAKSYGYLAIDDMVHARDFKLASQHLPHPEEYLLWLSDRLNHDLASSPPKVAKMRSEAYISNYCHDVEKALEILRGLGNSPAAIAALEWAIALVEPKAARLAVGKRLLVTS